MQKQNEIDYWDYPNGYEEVKKLIEFLPEEQKDGYLEGILVTFLMI